MSDERKKFKDTKLGGWLKEKAPKVLDVVGDFLPDNGVLGIVKNLIDHEPNLTPEQKAEFHRLENEFALELLKDKQNARGREIDFIKTTGHLDYFMWIVGIFVMLMYAACMAITVWVPLETSMRESFLAMRETSNNGFWTLVGYYFGSSASSRVKDMLSRK